MSCPDVQDANLILRLYELRRESVMREARDWFVSRFHPQSYEEFMQICPPGSDPHRMYRMVVSYWEMVGAFINNDVLDDDLYFQTTGEHVVVWLKVEPWVERLRKEFNLPHMLKNLELMAKKHLQWMDSRDPGSSASMRNLVKMMREQAPKSR